MDSALHAFVAGTGGVEQGQGAARCLCDPTQRVDQLPSRQSSTTLTVAALPGERGACTRSSGDRCRQGFCGDRVHECAQLQVLVEENLADNAHLLGLLLRERLAAIASPRVAAVRGKGLLNALIINDRDGVTAMDVCMRLRDNGLLAKPTQGNIIRCALRLGLKPPRPPPARALLPVPPALRRCTYAY